jgi:mannitol-1-phosphate/altronate dehydrogenase
LVGTPQVGALVVEDVTASELMKIRLLNGGHSAISYISYLLGHRDVDKSMADPRVVSVEIPLHDLIGSAIARTL